MAASTPSTPANVHTISVGTRGERHADKKAVLSVSTPPEDFMADTTNSPATLLDELVALGPAQRQEVAKEWRDTAETFAGVPDDRNMARTLGLLAHWLDLG